MDPQIKSYIKRRASWVRALYMVLFALIYSVAEIVLVAAVVFQFGCVLITGRPNGRLLAFGHSLSTFIYQMVLFFTYNTEERPFPFGAWPDPAPAPPLEPFDT